MRLWVLFLGLQWWSSRQQSQQSARDWKQYSVWGISGKLGRQTFLRRMVWGTGGPGLVAWQISRVKEGSCFWKEAEDARDKGDNPWMGQDPRTDIKTKNQGQLKNMGEEYLGTWGNFEIFKNRSGEDTCWKPSGFLAKSEVRLSTSNGQDRSGRLRVAEMDWGLKWRWIQNLAPA